MDDMKISFKVEITGCISDDANCPYLRMSRLAPHCSKVGINRIGTFEENVHKLTKTCPMVRAQFEALE